LKTCFKRVLGQKSIEYLGLRFQTELIFSNFYEKMEKVIKNCEKINLKQKNRTFVQLKMLAIEEKMKEDKEKALKIQNNEFSEKMTKKKQEISSFEQEIQEKALFFRNLYQNMQLQEKTIQEKEKSIEDLKLNKNKTKKVNNLFEKIEGIESQVDF